jgi:hypothetical protein
MSNDEVPLPRLLRVGLTASLYVPAWSGKAWRVIVYKLEPQDNPESLQQLLIEALDEAAKICTCREGHKIGDRISKV